MTSAEATVEVAANSDARAALLSRWVSAVRRLREQHQRFRATLEEVESGRQSADLAKQQHNDAAGR